MSETLCFLASGSHRGDLYAGIGCFIETDFFAVLDAGRYDLPHVRSYGCVHVEGISPVRVGIFFVLWLVLHVLSPQAKRGGVRGIRKKNREPSPR
ncbi:MAG: hypothetical protein WAK29_14660 [Terriglobales bacterium]